MYRVLVGAKKKNIKNIMRIFSKKHIIYSYNTIILFVHTIETIVYYNILYD